MNNYMRAEAASLDPATISLLSRCEVVLLAVHRLAEKSPAANPDTQGEPPLSQIKALLDEVREVLKRSSGDEP